jgi:hypothetical protein
LGLGGTAIVSGVPIISAAAVGLVAHRRGRQSSGSPPIAGNAVVAANTAERSPQSAAEHEDAEMSRGPDVREEG